MNEYIKYKDYCGSIEIDMEAKILHGKLLFISDIVTYEGNNAEELEVAFKDAVEDYLQTCEELNREPQKPYSGTFNVRIGEELHKKIAHKAAINDKFQSLNDLVKYALNLCIEEDNGHTVHHVHHIEPPLIKEVILPNFIGETKRNEWQIKSNILKKPH